MGIYYISILYLLGGGFKHFYFHPYLGKISILTYFDYFFSKGLKPPVSSIICMVSIA